MLKQYILTVNYTDGSTLLYCDYDELRAKKKKEKLLKSEYVRKVSFSTEIYNDTSNVWEPEWK